MLPRALDSRFYSTAQIEEMEEGNFAAGVVASEALQ